MRRAAATAHTPPRPIRVQIDSRRWVDTRQLYHVWCSCTRFVICLERPCRGSSAAGAGDDEGDDKKYPVYMDS